MQDFIKIQFDPRPTALSGGGVFTFWSTVVLKAPFDYEYTFNAVKREQKVTDGGNRKKKVSGLSIDIKMIYKRMRTDLETVNNIEKIIRADSTRVRAFLNPSLRPEQYLEAYLQPKIDTTDVFGTIKGTSDKVALILYAQSPGAAEFTNIVEFL